MSDQHIKKQNKNKDQKPLLLHEETLVHISNRKHDRRETQRAHFSALKFNLQICYFPLHTGKLPQNPYQVITFLTSTTRPILKLLLHQNKDQPRLNFQPLIIHITINQTNQTQITTTTLLSWSKHRSFSTGCSKSTPEMNVRCNKSKLS